MKHSLLLSLFAVALLSACASTYQYQKVDDMQKFYADKLSCERQYDGGFNIWGNKVYGDIYVESPARDCMLAKGYKSASM